MTLAALPRTACDRSRRGSSRRGSVLLMVMGVAVIVAILAISTLLLNRQVARRSRTVADGVQAACLAKSGLQLGLHAIQQDPDWRANYTHGFWLNDLKSANGSIWVAGFDPTDGDLADDENEPLQLVGSAVVGNASRALAATVQPTTQLFDCVHSLVHAGRNLQAYGGTIHGNGIVSTNGNVNVTGSNVHANVQATGFVSGFTILGEKQSSAPAISMPDPAELMATYESLGTEIDLTAVPLAPPPPIATNGDFQGGINPWVTYSGGTVSLYNVGRTDSSSLKFSNRTLPEQGPGQDVTGKIAKGGKLLCSCWITTVEPVPSIVGKINAGSPEKAPAGPLGLGSIDSVGSVPGVDSGSGTVTGAGGADGDGVVDSGDSTGGATVPVTTDSYAMFLEVITTSETRQIQLTPWQQITTGWGQLSGDATTDWLGTLQRATCYVRSQSTNATMWIDDVVVEEDVSDLHLIHRVVFSPGHNPFGGPPNADGIYIINCQNQTVAVDRIRCVGTLVFKNVGIKCVFRGSPSCMTPAVSGYPILVVDGSLYLEATDDGLVEAHIGVNLNPVHAPYRGESDLDLADVYPSRFNGLIYSSGSIYFHNEPLVTGPIVADQNVSLYGGHIRSLGFPRYRDNVAIPGFFQRGYSLDLSSVKPTSPVVNP